MKEIYRNEEMISKESFQKEKDAKIANDTLKKLKATGLELDDNMLSNLFQNPKALIEEAKRQADEDLEKISKFNFIPKDSAISSFIERVEKIIDEYERVYRSVYSTGSKEYLIVKNGEVKISDAFYEKLERNYAVKMDTPEKKKAYELANKAMDAINELEDFMKKHGDGKVHGVSCDVGIYNQSLIVLSGKMDKWEWKPRLYPYVMNHIIK